MRIAFCTTVLPTERRTGSEIASAAFADALRAAGHEVTVLGYRRRGGTAPGPGEEAVGERPIETDVAGLWPGVWLAGALASGRAYSEQKYVSRAYLRHLDAQIEGRRTLVIVDHAQLAWLLSARPGIVPAAFIAHNVEHRLYEARAAGADPARGSIFAREARRIRLAEIRLARRARQTWALTASDAAAFEALGGQARAFALPPRPLPPLRSAEVEPDLPVLVFGTWTWAANRAGLVWLLDEVLPHLPPGLEIHVAGLGAEALLRDRPRVVAHGFVDDLPALVARARVLAVPSVQGEGVQIKTLDALATGRPVVATRVAVRGLDDLPPRLLRADTPRDFAEALGRAATMAPDTTAGQAWAEARRAAFEAQVRAAMDDLCAPHDP